MGDVEIVHIEKYEREGMVPVKVVDNSPSHGTNHASKNHEPPDPCQNSHVTILIALVCLGIARGYPLKCRTKQFVLKCIKIGVVLNDHDVLNIETVVGFGPQWEKDCSIEDTWEGECEVEVFEEIGAYPKQKNARYWAEEDADSSGGIVKEAYIKSVTAVQRYGSQPYRKRNKSFASRSD